MDTIFAQATARGKAGVAIIRVSGRDAFTACHALCGDVPSPRRSSLRLLRNAAGEILDEALVLTFTEGASYTGEPSVEFHVHGGRAVCDGVLDALQVMPGLRLAEAGEFTRRALLNDRMDLTQVEGLADLIEAETESQRRLALRTFSGEMSAQVGEWRHRLLRAMALIEATIDFADEEVPVDVSPEVDALLSALADELSLAVRGSRTAERVRDGFEVAIVGRPNVGKSTLLNALAGRQAALTSAIAGTTRDVIEVRFDLRGLAVTFLDTAGLRETADEVEAAGVALATERAAAADLRVILLEHESDSPPFVPLEGDIVLVGKGDVREDTEGAISGKTGLGVEALLANIYDTLSDRVAGMSPLSHRRQRLAVEEGLACVLGARERLSDGSGAELAAEDLRRGVHALSVLIGDIDVENVLGEIFASFCIGK